MPINTGIAAVFYLSNCQPRKYNMPDVIIQSEHFFVQSLIHPRTAVDLRPIIPRICRHFVHDYWLL